MRATPSAVKPASLGFVVGVCASAAERGSNSTIIAGVFLKRAKNLIQISSGKKCERSRAGARIDGEPLSRDTFVHDTNGLGETPSSCQNGRSSDRSRILQ